MLQGHTYIKTPNLYLERDKLLDDYSQHKGLLNMDSFKCTLKAHSCL